MKFARASLLAAVLAVVTGQAHALSSSDCTRVTHVSHGGEADHTDLGEGRVMWRDWWSNEGTATDFVIVECSTGDALSFRTAEHSMTKRLPFDRTDTTLKIVEEQHKASRVFVPLVKLSQAVSITAVDRELFEFSAEPCACAALYPDLRGNKKAFVLEG